MRQQSPKALRCATLTSRLVTITWLGPVPKRRMCALISVSTHSSAGMVRVDASVLRSAASWPDLPMSGHCAPVYLCADLHAANVGSDRRFSLVVPIGGRSERRLCRVAMTTALGVPAGADRFFASLVDRPRAVSATTLKVSPAHQGRLRPCRPHPPAHPARLAGDHHAVRRLAGRSGTPGAIRQG